MFCSSVEGSAGSLFFGRNPLKYPVGKITAFVAALMVVLGGLSFGTVGFGTPAQAYEIATSPANLNGPGTVATLSMPGSGLTTTFGRSGYTNMVGQSTMGSRGYVSSDFSQNIGTGAPAVEFATHAVNNCAATGPCSGLGTIIITFSQPVRSPVLNIAGLGGEVDLDETDNGTVDRQSQLSAVLNLATPGLTMTKLSGANLSVANNAISTSNNNAGTACNTSVQTGTPDPADAQATAACGSVRINGIVTSLTFDISAVFVQTTSTLPPYTENSMSAKKHNQDNFLMAMTVPQDFGDAPVSYDQGNAARAVLSDVTLGADVTEDNATVANGTASPNAGVTAAQDLMDDGVVLAPMTQGATSYSTTVAISGASKAGTTCGWIDFNKNGTFDNTAERACATFLAGATTATLAWVVPAGVSAGTTYARFRIGYTAAQVQVPIGASDSGEVEDYIFTVAPAAAPAITLVKTVNKTTLVAGETATYTFVAKNTGNVTLTSVVITETQFSGTGTMSALSYAWPGLPGILLPGQSVTATATYVVTASDVTTGLLTNTAKVTGNPPLGLPVSAVDDAQVTAPPAWKIKKSATVNGSVPASGSVTPGQTIVYTVTASSISGTITGVVLKDNLAEVLDDATFVPGSASLVIGTGSPVAVADPVPPSTVLSTAAFTLPAGQTATLKYSVLVKAGAWNEQLVNVVTGTATTTPPQTCAPGSGAPGPDCTTTHHTPGKVLIEKIGESSSGTWVPMAGSTWVVHVDNAGTPGAVLASPAVTAVAGQTGRFQLEGIQPGTYWLEETTAPDGFSLLAEPVQFTIAANGAVSLGQGSQGQGAGAGVVTSTDADGDGIFLLTVRDVPALELPESGGIGWWPFTTAGSVLLAGALALTMAANRRRQQESTTT
ncbi:putative repeat protein (TIGR01451 family) [Arthrobacter sp. 2762]